MSAAPTPRTLAGIVVSAGKMMKTVKVRIARQVFDAHIRKVRTIPFPLFPPSSFPLFPLFSPR